MEQNRRRTSCISDIRLWSQFDAGGGNGAIATVAGAIRQCGLAKARIGIEIGPNDRLGLSLPFLQAVQAALPGVDWLDASKVMGPVRGIKSPREIDTIRTACAISCEAIGIGMDAIKAGMSEKELGQIICLEIAKRTPDVCTIHPWFLFVHGTGRGPSAYDGMPTSYRFRAGDYVYVDGGLNYHGYNADMIRCASIGVPDPETLIAVTTGPMREAIQTWARHDCRHETGSQEPGGSMRFSPLRRLGQAGFRRADRAAARGQLEIPRPCLGPWYS